MFQTNLRTKIPFQPDDEAYLWSEVELNIHRPWFFVTVVNADNEIDLRTMLMLMEEDSLQALLQEQTVDRYVEQVFLVTPAYVNGTGRWQLESLTQLVSYHEMGSELTLEYTVDSTRTYVTGNRRLVGGRHPNRKVIFSPAMLGAH